MNARIAITALVCAVLGAAAGWYLKPTEPDRQADALPAERAASPAPASAPELGSGITVLKAELDGARKEREVELARRMEAEQAVARLQKEVQALRSAAAKGTAPDAPQVAAGARFEFQKYKQALEAVDWDVAGDALAHMSPLLGAYATSLIEGKPPPPSVGQIQRYNGPLVTAALQAQQTGIPGTGTNGAFTHISMLANMVYVTLVKSGKPLTESQEKQLRALADELLQEDERRLAGYGEGSFALEKIMGETAIKDRFYGAIDKMVSDEQRELLHPANLRGRLSFDLFSSGLVWATVLKPMRYAKAEELSGHVPPQFIARFAVRAEHKSIVEDAIAEWLKSFPAGYLDEKSDVLAANGAVKIERVRIAAERQLAMFKTIVSRLPADAPEAVRLRTESAVFVPMRR